MRQHATGWLTVDEAAVEMKVSGEAVHQLIASGALAAGTVGEELRIPVSSLERYAARAERAASRRRLVRRRPLVAVGAAALLLAGAGIAAVARPAAQVVPLEIPYEGTLEKDGAPVTNPSVPMQFQIYKGETDTTAVWSEQQTVSVQDGAFSVALGSASPIDQTVFNQPSLYLSINVDGQPLTGRQKLLTVPFARQAYAAEKAVVADLATRAENATNVDSVPPGAVMFFNMTACPAGWSELTSARGRAIVGMQPGGALNFTVGTGLGDRENRGHTHGMYHSHGMSFWSQESQWSGPAYGQNASGYKNNPGVFVVDTSTDEMLGYNHVHLVQGNTGGPSVANTAFGYTADVMPYVQLLVCQKN